MYRNERPGVFRHRYSFHSKKPSEFPPAQPLLCNPRRPPFFPRRRILIHRFPNQGTRPSFQQSTPLINNQPLVRPDSNFHFSAPQSCTNFTFKSMERPEMPFAHSNISENIRQNSISYTSPVPQKENFDANNRAVFVGGDMQGSDDMWIETTAPSGRIYYYNANSRISRWDKPENVKIMNLDVLRMMANSPHISPMHNTNVPSIDPIYAHLNQQSHLRYYTPLQVAAGIQPRIFMFPPPNLNSPPPFQVRNTSIPALPGISQLPGYSSEAYTDTSIKEESRENVAIHPTFGLQESVLMNRCYFEDALQNRQTDNETKGLCVENEPTGIKLQENDADHTKSTYQENYTDGSTITYQTQEEQAPLNDSFLDSTNDGSMRNEPVNNPCLDVQGETQISICENDRTSSVKINVTETIIKPVDKSRPVSSTPISGSKWCVVWTGDGRVFFYDVDHKISVWEMPDELNNREDVQKLVESPPIKIEDKQSDISSSKKIKIEEEDKTELIEENQATSSKKTDDLILEAVKKRKELPHDTRVKIFLQMLSEKNISAFSTMKNELRKVVFDSRYLLLPPKERKQKFECYLREKTEEEKIAKMKKALKIKDEYNNLLKETVVTEKTRFIDFMGEHSKDPRYQALDKLKDREALFNAYIKSLRKKSHDLDDKQKTAFLELLKENNVDANINWLDAKKLLSSDDRYSSISNEHEREKLFNEYIQKHMSRELRSVKEKEDRITASIKTREEEVQRELSVHLKELDKERQYHKYDATISRFKALLVDLVRKPDLSWREAKKVLKADHRWADVSNLRDDIRMNYFDKHINYLIKKKKENFHNFLSEIPEITLFSVWKDFKKQVLDDPRCKQFSSDTRKCEKAFNMYVSNKLKDAKIEFKELLKETKMITHASKNLMKTTNHLESIVKALEHDNRYLVLKFMEKERDEMLLSYIDKLHRKGPPPPPTATESVKH